MNTIKEQHLILDREAQEYYRLWSNKKEEIRTLQKACSHPSWQTTIGVPQRIPNHHTCDDCGYQEWCRRVSIIDREVDSFICEKCGVQEYLYEEDGPSS